MHCATPKFFATLCLLALGWLAVARGAEVTVSAGLTQNAASVGETVQLQVKIAGARGNPQPPEIAVDGLAVQYLGPSQSTSMRLENGRMTTDSHVIHVYSVRPEREGTFTIPALPVEVDGRQFRTQALTLRVQKGAAEGSGRQVALGELEIVVPKKTAFVGEMVPVEVRLSVDSRVRWEPQAMPDLAGEGFTKQKMPEPRQEHGRKDGREMDVLVFRTAITPGKAGKLKLGPVEVPYVALVPRAQRQRRGSLLDLFNDDVFGDPFFSERQQFRAKAEAVQIDVKPLPAAGRPDGFSGAVGQFKFTAEGSPRQVKVGDPVTMKLTVSGRGNFDRVEAPALADGSGWRAYPPAANFKADDDLSLSGTKTFEMAVIPEVKKTAMPVFVFSYFDPEKAQYVTLESEPAPLTVEGGAPPPPPPVAAAASEFAAAPTAPPPPAPEASDILGVRYDAGQGRASFEPLYARRGFLLAQLVPLALLLALAAPRFLRTNADAGRVAEWRREKAAVLAKLRRSEEQGADFFTHAARVIQLETALAAGREPGSVDAAAARSILRLDEASAEVVEEVFASRAELLYAGGGGGAPRLSLENRHRVLATLEKLGRSATHA